MKEFNISLVWQQFLDWDDGAYNMICNEYEPRVFICCNRILNDKDLAKDAVQDWNIELLIHRQKFHHVAKKIDNISSWLMGIARHVALKKLKKNSHSKKNYSLSQPKNLYQAEEYLCYIESSELIEKLIYEKKIEELNKLIHQLTNRDQRLILCMYSQGCSISEIGKHLGQKKSWVSQHKHRAIKTLNKIHNKIHNNKKS